MMYHKNFCVCIKNRGKILREVDGEIVFLPFGEEYSILLKNLESRNALVSVFIDGKEAISDLIVPKNSTVDLERFIGNDNQKGYKFKFIEKTEEISNFRGNGAEDGVITVKYRFEKFYEPPFSISYESSYRSNPYFKSNDILQIGCCTIYGSGRGSKSLHSNNTDGITVEGNKSNQKFTSGYIGDLEFTEHTISLKLKGKNVKEPILVKSKMQCHTCRKSNKSKNKFCSNCGTALFKL